MHVLIYDLVSWNEEEGLQLDPQAEQSGMNRSFKLMNRLARFVLLIVSLATKYLF